MASSSGYIVNGGEIPLRYFDQQSFDLTYKVSGFGLSFKDVYEGLNQIIRGDDIVDICKVDSNVFNVTVGSFEAAELIDSVGQIRVKDRVFPIMNISHQKFEFRVHWLPGYIRDTFLEDYFSKYGKISSIVRESSVYSPHDTKRNNVRRVMIETDDVQKRSLPYMVNFNGGYTALLTVPGRPPLCLRCKSLGHLRKDCQPAGDTRKASRSYAEAARPTPPPQNEDATVENEANEEDASQSSTGSTIPPNVPKRPLDDGDDDEHDDSEDKLMMDDEKMAEWAAQHGKKVRK